MPNYRFAVSLGLLLFFTSVLHANEDSLWIAVKTIAKDARGKVSVSAIYPSTQQSFAMIQAEHCAMQSVFKFPVALAILDKIDKGEFSLQHKIHVTSKDMIPDTWSPMRDKYPDGNVNITFEELLRYMVSESDNIACDILLHHLGGPKKVQKYIRKTGLDQIAIKVNEVQMHKSWKNQYKNWCSPVTMSELLLLFYEQKLLSETNTDFLFRLMAESVTGKNRIVKKLPQGTVVAHKTGSSGKNELGMYSGVNDAGIILLPDGKPLVLSVFVNDAYAEYEVLESVIARISESLFNYYNK
jgi:beta-lactamase class A